MRAMLPALVATVLLSILSSFAWGATYVIDSGGGGDFATIQSGVDHAASEDTLLIRAGVYLENVVSVGTYVTCMGEGAGSTILRGVSDSPAYDLPSSDPNTPTQFFIDMTIERSAASDDAVTWRDGHVEFMGCEVIGRAVAGGEPYGLGTFRQSSVSEIAVLSHGTTVIEDCEVGSASFTGYYFQDPWGGGTYCQHHGVSSSGSEIGTVYVSCSSFESAGDHVGHLELGYWSSCDAAGSTFGSIGTDDGARLELDHCIVEGNIDLSPMFSVHEDPCVALMEYCTIVGDFSIVADWWGADPRGWVELYHNTFVGDVSHTWYYPGFLWPYHLRGNVVLGQASFEFVGDPAAVVATRNDFAGGLSHNSAWPDSVHSNIYVDPLMCDPTGGDYTLQDCSPCIGAAHDGGDMGAYGVGCECFTTVLPTTWGRLKALYR